MESLVNQIKVYADANYPILYLDTFEEEKAIKVVRKAFEGKERLRILEWNILGHYVFKKVNGEEKNTVSQPDEPIEEMFATYIKSQDEMNRSVFILRDILSQLEKPVVVGQIKYLANQIVQGKIKDCTIILIAPSIKIPKELAHLVTVLRMPELLDKEIVDIIKDVCQELCPKDETLLLDFVNGFKGLSEFEIRSILAYTLAENGGLSKSDVTAIREQKKQIVQKSGILEMIDSTETLDNDIGGLANLKRWLKRKAYIIKNVAEANRFNQAFDTDIPRGVMIAGMPGCGKSLSAKATATTFGANIPLLRLDVGRLLGKYVGESEENLRKALKLAEAVSPCVLWIDELEKAIAGTGGQGGNAEVTTRLLGTLLTWMQEHRHLVFLVATANNIDSIPPEFMRKGRFDEIFYVDFPEEKEREHIFRIHLKKRRPDDNITEEDITSLAKQTDGFSGADIEGIVKDAVEECFSCGKRAVTMDDLIKAKEAARPLSETNKEEMKKMREFFSKHHFINASLERR